MRSFRLTLLIAAFITTGCTTASGSSTTVATTSIPTTVSSVTATTASASDSTSSSAPQRTSTTRLDVALDDLPVIVGETVHLVPSAICDADPETLRSLLNQLTVQTQRGIEELASGWPTTTIAPNVDELQAVVDQRGIAATAIAVREDRLGLLEQRWADFNQQYSELEGASGGPIDEARIKGWNEIGTMVAAGIDSACADLG